MKFKFNTVVLLALATLVALAALPKSAYASFQSQDVTVSYYGNGGPHECGKNRPCHGARTACGQVFSKYRISVANKTLPCGSLVRFCRGDTCLTAPVNDRGPYVKGRSFDLSTEAARRLGLLEDGVARLQVTVLTRS